MVFKVKLKNVGRQKVNKELLITAGCYEELEDKIVSEASKYLVSSEVYLEVAWTHSGGEGSINAGFHKVGEFEARELIEGGDEEK